MPPRTRQRSVAVDGVDVLPLDDLPLEIQLRVLEHLDDFSDCAAVSLAAPPLGLAALQSGLQRFRDPLFAVAMRLATVRRARIDEQLLRQYAADDRATSANFPWIARVSPNLHLCSESLECSESGKEAWRLWSRGAHGAHVRAYHAGCVFHFKGELNAECLVRSVSREGDASYYEGGLPGRRTRLVSPDGTVTKFDGESGTERVVRMDLPDGSVWHYEGGQELERVTRIVRPGGWMTRFEGDRNEERIVRMHGPGGFVMHLEGERGAERRVRLEQIDFGIISHFEGESGSERMVSIELPGGQMLLPNRDWTWAEDGSLHIEERPFNTSSCSSRAKRTFVRSAKRSGFEGWSRFLSKGWLM